MNQPIEIHYASPELSSQSRIWKSLLVLLLAWSIFELYGFVDSMNLIGGMAWYISFFKKWHIQSMQLGILGTGFAFLAQMALLPVIYFCVDGWRNNVTSRWMGRWLACFCLFSLIKIFFYRWSDSFNWRALPVKSQIMNWLSVYRAGLFDLLVPCVVLFLFPVRNDIDRMGRRIRIAITVSIVLLMLAVFREYWDSTFAIRHFYDQPNLAMIYYGVIVMRLVSNTVLVVLGSIFLLKRMHRWSVLMLALLPLSMLVEFLIKSIYWRDWATGMVTSMPYRGHLALFLREWVPQVMICIAMGIAVRGRQDQLDRPCFGPI